MIIIESPGKIKKYQHVLGSGYEIISSFGHCIDLPKKNISVNIKKDFEPSFEIIPGKEEHLQKIVKAAKQAKSVALMADSDREGEGLSYLLYEHIKHIKVPICRSTTNEITEKGIKNALANPREIDMNKVDAFLCRRILDRLCGYKYSFLTQQATGGKSAGRVQSAVLRIIVDRELEILNFKPEKYWVFTATFAKTPGEKYVGVYTTETDAKFTEVWAESASKTISSSSPFISEVEVKQSAVNPYAPFTTLPLIASASTLFGWNAKKTMSVAQNLYQSGYISYMRSDSTFLSEQAIKSLRECVGTKYGAKYLTPAPKQYTSKKGAQEAHEAIRPTEPSNIPHLTGDEQKLYDMIWKRAVSCQMNAGQDERTKIVTNAGGYEFISRGNVILFDGFRKCWDYGKNESVFLPSLAKDDKCTILALEKEQKETSPPSRYSDASLSKKCENEQIGRPATFANFLETLTNRKYIKREKKSFIPTELGMRVIEFLKKADVCFVDIAFTAGMEDLLDAVATDKKKKLDVLNDFWTRLQHDIASGKQIKIENEKTEFQCPKCNGILLKKHSLFGPFFSCEHYSKKEDGCKYTATVGDHGQPVEKIVKPKEYADFNCKKCNAKMIKRESKFGSFYGCSKYPFCRVTADMDGTFKEPKKKFYKKKEDQLND